jgi:hypothetical protein
MSKSQTLASMLCDRTGPATVLVFLFAASLHAQSPRPVKTTVLVTGEFRENGSCQVFADGVAVFHLADSAETTYIRDATLNVAPSGFESHEIWCGPRSADQPAPPIDANERMFVVMLYAPTGTLAKPRTYQIRAGLPTRENAPFRAGAALFGVSPQMLNDTMPIHFGLLYLAGSRGNVVITHVMAERIVGRFTIHTRQALTM